MTKKTNQIIFIIVMIVVLFFLAKGLGYIQTGVTDARSVPFILSQTLTDNQIETNTHLTWGSGFDFEQTEPTHPNDVTTATGKEYADVDCYDTGCRDYNFGFKLNGNDLDLNLGQTNQFHPLAEIKYNTILIVNNNKNEVDSSETSGGAVEIVIRQERYNESLLTEAGLDRYAGYDATEFALIKEFDSRVFLGRTIDGKRGSASVVDTNTARRITKNPIPANFREYISSFDLRIEKGAIRVIGGDFSKLQDVAVGDKVKIPITLENRLWGGLRGRLVIVQTNKILATGGLQDTYSSETKDIAFGNNTFEIEVPVSYSGETEIKIYPILDNVPQKLNGILLDDATRFDFETQKFDIVGETSVFLGTQEFVDSLGESSVPTSSEATQIDSKFDLKDFFFSHWTSIVFILVGLLILGYIGTKTKWNWKIVGISALILVALFYTAYHFDIIQTGVPSEVRILQEDGYILCDPLLYEDVLGDGMQVTEDAFVGSSDRRRRYSEEGDVYKFSKEGDGFYEVNDGFIKITRGTHYVNFDVKSCGGRTNISDFRYQITKYWDAGSDRIIRTTEVTEIHHNYAEGTTEFVRNGIPSESSGISALGSVRINVPLDSSTNGASYTSVGHLMYKDLFNCKSDFNDALVYNDFEVGDIVDLQTIKNLGNPAVSFCPETPVQILNLVTGAQRNDRDIVIAIINRRSIQVPEGQKWRVQYYVNRENANIPSDCALYDMDKKECSVSGLTGEIMADGTPTIPSSSGTDTTPASNGTIPTTPSTPQSNQSTAPSPSGTLQSGVSDVGAEALSDEGKVSTFVNDHPYYAIMISIIAIVLLLYLIAYFSGGKKGKKR